MRSDRWSAAEVEKVRGGGPVGHNGGGAPRLVVGRLASGGLCGTWTGGGARHRGVLVRSRGGDTLTLHVPPHRRDAPYKRPPADSDRIRIKSNLNVIFYHILIRIRIRMRISSDTNTKWIVRIQIRIRIPSRFET